jgi:hypothetical protein
MRCARPVQAGAPPAGRFSRASGGGSIALAPTRRALAQGRGAGAAPSAFAALRAGLSAGAAGSAL